MLHTHHIPSCDGPIPCSQHRRLPIRRLRAHPLPTQCKESTVAAQRGRGKEKTHDCVCVVSANGGTFSGPFDVVRFRCRRWCVVAGPLGCARPTTTLAAT